MMRKLLLITYTFPPDGTAAAVRPGQLYDYLPKLGYEPIVIASSFEGAASDCESIRRVPEPRPSWQARRASKLAGAFMRHFAPYNDRLPWVPHAISAAMDVMRRTSVDAVFSTSPFLAGHFAARWIKARCGLPWIADFQDPICDNPFRTRRWPYPYDPLIERSFFRHADRVIANTDTVAAAWRQRYPVLSGKISVLWNSFDPREDIAIAEVPPRPYRILAHVGTLYGGRDPSRIMSALDRLEVSASDVRLKLVGPIEPQLLERRKSMFDRLEQKGVLEYGNRLVERSEALKETAEADTLLLLDINERNASFQVPSKLLDYIRYGKPILAYTPKDSPVERILARSGISYVAIDPTEDPAAEELKIRTFLELPAEPRRANPWFDETFNAETQARTVADLLDGLFAGHEA